MIQVVVNEGDITELPVDAIVNAANSKLIMGSGVAGAIRERGGPAIQEGCKWSLRYHGPLHPGDAVETNAGLLRAQYVIHAVTMADPGGETSPAIISDATDNALVLADRLGCGTIAIPALGTGVGGFSLLECARLMIKAVDAYARRVPDSDLWVIFSVWGEEAERIFRWACQESGWKRETHYIPPREG